MNDIILSTQNGEPVASSRDVAKRFGKEHRNVMQSIKNISAENSAVTQMFYQTTYTAGTGKKYPMYLMNRDGFSLLAMGFTGKEAVQWKLKYIEAFNQMEKQLAEQHKDQLALKDARIQSALQSVAYAQKNLAIARKNHKLYLEARDDTKNLLAQARALHAKRCDAERKAAQVEQDWQAYLDSQIDQLKIAAFGLPAFEEIMADIFTPEKKEVKPCGQK